MLGLCCCARAFSSCSEQELFSSCGAWASHCGASLVAEQGLYGARDLVVAKQGLTRPEAYGIFLDQARAYPPRGVWDLPGPGIRPVAPALQGGLWTTGPPGKPKCFFFFSYVLFFVGIYLLYNTVWISAVQQSESAIYIYTYTSAKSLQSYPTLSDPMDCSPTGSSVHGASPGKNTGVGCHALLQGIFPTQGSNWHLLHFLH